jgi:hypothetical protein
MAKLEIELTPEQAQQIQDLAAYDRLPLEEWARQRLLPTQSAKSLAEAISPYVVSVEDRQPLPTNPISDANGLLNTEEGNSISERVAEQGSAIYESLRHALEPRFDGQFVAIHIQSGDYTMDHSTASAMRAIRRSHDEGPLYLRKIGSEPEYGLASRLLEGEMHAASNHL